LSFSFVFFFLFRRVEVVSRTSFPLLATRSFILALCQKGLVLLPLAIWLGKDKANKSVCPSWKLMGPVPLVKYQAVPGFVLLDETGT
jgi:hypothetical protein